MRKIGLAALLLGTLWLSGCQKPLPPVQPTNATLPPVTRETTEPFVQPLLVTRSGRILEMLWHFYDAEDFPCCGGSGKGLTLSAPGELDLSDTDALTKRMYLPEEVLGDLEEGASLTHLFQVNLFNCGVFRLKDGVDMGHFAAAWRKNLHGRTWLDGIPEQLLLMKLDSRHIFMAVGKPQRLQGMENAAKRVFTASRVLFHEGVTP